MIKNVQLLLFMLVSVLLFTFCPNIIIDINHYFS